MGEDTRSTRGRYLRRLRDTWNVHPLATTAPRASLASTEDSSPTLVLCQWIDYPSVRPNCEFASMRAHPKLISMRSCTSEFVHAQRYGWQIPVHSTWSQVPHSSRLSRPCGMCEYSPAAPIVDEFVTHSPQFLQLQ